MNIYQYYKHIYINLNSEINNCTFDGYFYYFTIQGLCEILKTDLDLNVVECYKTYRDYDCICYDYKEDCFWASSENCINYILKLNCDMVEVDYIIISDRKYISGIITGISYNWCNDKLVISFKNCIVEINKYNKDIVVKYNSNQIFISSVLSLSPGYIIISSNKKKQFIYILNSKGKIVYSDYIYCNGRIKSIISNSSIYSGTRNYLDFLVIKNGCHPYLYTFKLNLNSSYLKLGDCNHKIYDDYCKKREVNKLCIDMLESIALEGAAIANVLNVEGEKLQKALCLTKDIDKILCINKEITKTIINVTNLEYVLYTKLSTLNDSDMWGDVCDDKNYN